MFAKYGKIASINMKRDYGFIEYEDKNQAMDAIKAMDGQKIDGHRIIVQQALVDRRKLRGPEHADICYNCGRRGHW